MQNCFFCGNSTINRIGKKVVCSDCCRQMYLVAKDRSGLDRLERGDLAKLEARMDEDNHTCEGE